MSADDGLTVLDSQGVVEGRRFRPSAEGRNDSTWLWKFLLGRLPIGDMLVRAVAEGHGAGVPAAA